MNSKPVLSLIVPCYNPDPGWEKIVIEKFEAFKTQLPDSELKLTIVNDGSISGIDENNIKYLRENIPAMQWLSYQENKGKGYALRQGVKSSEGDYYLYTDIDFPYTTESIIDVYKDLVQGADIVVGIREDEYYYKVPAKRVVISKFVKKLIKYLLNTAITDTQCGLKGFNQKGREVFLKTTINRFLFDMEFVKYASQTKGLVIKPQVVYSRPGIVFSHMNYRALMGEMFSFMGLFLNKPPQRRKDTKEEVF